MHDGPFLHPPPVCFSHGRGQLLRQAYLYLFAFKIKARNLDFKKVFKTFAQKLCNIYGKR